MKEFNYILSGFGHATGKFEVTNRMLEEAAKKNMLDGFNPELIKHSKNYQAYLKDHPDVTPFEYFVGHKMGFQKRHHVTPWPPIKQNQDVAENSLDLLVEAVQKTLDDAQLDAEDIDGWIVSTVSPQEQAPGIAATLKCYFTKDDNNTPAMTLTSGCAGFNIALRRSLDYFRSRSEINNILIANTETMSHFLNRKRDFVFHATFGDAAAAAIISKVPKNGEHAGVGAILNHHDLRMIDFVGVDKDWNLYMDGGAVKQRAVPNLVSSSKEVLARDGWSLDDVDLVVPHQTGNAILHTVADELELPKEKMYQEAQQEYGNVSGTTIPIALSMLHEQGRLKPGMKLLCPTAGVGGEYGAWSYVVPKSKQSVDKKPKRHHPLLEDKKILILFADNALGLILAEKLKQTRAHVLFHVSNKNEYKTQLEDITATYSDLAVMYHPANGVDDAKHLLNKLEGEQWDYVLNIGLAAESPYTINDLAEATSTIHESYDRLSRGLLLNTKETIVALGHPLENAPLTEPSPVASVASGWHGLLGSMAGEAVSKGVRTIWFVPAVYEALTHYLSSKSKIAAMKGMQQEVLWKDVDQLAERLIRSLYLLKVANTYDKYQGPMILRTDACAFRKSH